MSENVGEKIFKFDPQEAAEEVAVLQLFGWEIVSKKNVKEMVAVNTFENLVKVVAKRDESTEQGKQLAKLEADYAALTEKRNAVNVEKGNLCPLGERPKWSWWTTDRGYGSYFVYYGNYKPVGFFNIVFLVPPLIVLGLPLLLIKLHKNKKSKAKYNKEVAEYDAKALEYEAKKKAFEEQLQKIDEELDEVIAQAKELY